MVSKSLYDKNYRIGIHYIAGIFGYLSLSSDQTLEFEKQSTELLTIEERIEQLDEDKVFLKEELEQQISELPDNYILKRNLREEYNPQITQINQELLEYKTRRQDLEIELVSTGVDVVLQYIYKEPLELILIGRKVLYFYSYICV